MRSWIIPAASLMAISAPALSAEQRTYYDNDGWLITQYSTHCIASVQATLKDGEPSTFGLYYDAADRYLSINFFSRVTTSLKDGQEAEAELYFTNKARDTLDDGWGSVKFDVSKTDDGETLFMAKIKADAIQTMLDDVSANTHVGLMKNDVIFAGAELSGSAIAVRRLKTCAFEAAGLNPKDPFAQ